MLVMGMKHSPIAKAEILIRKPVAEVFEAFVDPTITARFWFTKGSGRLEAGEQVRWDWEMYDFSLQVDVKAVEENARILIQWLAFGAPTTVEWIFTPRPDGTTFVSEEQWIFRRRGAGRTTSNRSTEGFAFVLAGLKALLEHNVTLNLVLDRFPDGIGKH
jgi:uncharacterized protein YndB with AHSA1/START domain